MQFTVISLVGMLATTIASPMVATIDPSLAKRDVIGNLREGSDPLEVAVQPLVDFDSNGCYQTSAIDSSVRTNPGHGATGTPQGGCRDKRQLDSSNTYSRKRCNNGYCAIMYEYYFEKDQAVGGSFAGGHRHDWENIIVFTKGNEVVQVSPSCHGAYAQTRTKNDGIPKNDRHPLVVYHKDSTQGLTHCFRFANNNDIAHPENPTGGFFRAPLVGWSHWPSVDLRNKMLDAWKGGIGPKLDGEFAAMLRLAADTGRGVPGFDPNTDS